MNRVPVFYTDICGKGILFKGTAKKEKIVYKSFYHSFFPQKQLINKTDNNLPNDRMLYHKLIKEIGKGDQIELCDTGLIIRKGAKIVSRVDKPNHLYWRIMDFR